MGYIMKKRYFAVMLLGVLACGGCAAPGRIEKDGQEYGVTKGVFRGRWWSYYERAGSYIAGEFYKEAEADLRKALAGRAVDAWQTRTYGLHFVEYFPNREMGVVCYHLGRLDEAENYLKTSLSQVDTARAHHYLDQITRQKIAQGAVKAETPPAVETSVPDGAVIATPEIPVEIKVADPIGVANVKLNDNPLPQRNSAEAITFKQNVPLKEGTQEIKVAAGNLGDKETTKTIKVEVDLSGPTIGIYTPTDAMITEAALTRLEGTSVDKNGVTAITVGEKTLAQSPTGEKRLSFATDLPLHDGENTFIVIARDVAGNETRSAGKVFKGKPNSVAARLWLLKQRAPKWMQLATAGNLAVLSELLFGQDASATAPPLVNIALKSPDPARPYRHSKTLTISGDAVSASKVASLSINGQPVAELTGAPKESFNKRIPIETKDGAPAKMAVSVKATDDQGHEAVKEFDVALQPISLDKPESKMPVAVLGFAGQNVDPATSELLRVSTEGKLLEAKRFRVIDRQHLQEVLTEQQLAAALANPKDAISLGKLTNAQVFVVADVFDRDQKGLEIKARAVSAETSEFVGGPLDVYIDDKADRAKVEAGCNTLADMFSKNFPRLSGELMAVKENPSGDEMLVNWTKEDGVQPGAYLLIVQQGEPWIDDSTGEVLEPGEISEIGRARIESILTNASKAKAIKRENENVKFEKGMAALTM